MVLLTSLCLAALTALSGCVYIRLLQVKRQLAEAELHVRLATQDGLTLTFSHPVLLPEDILFLARRRPSRMQEIGSKTRWIYSFVKKERNGGQNANRFDVPVDLSFFKGKLCQARLPERFGRVLTSAYLLRSIKAVGHASVDVSPRRVRGHAPSEDSNRAGTRLPSRRDILELFGPPYREHLSPGDRQIHYRYSLLPGEDDPEEKASRARLVFHFRRPDGRLLRVKARFAGITLLLSYPEE